MSIVNVNQDIYQPMAVEGGGGNGENQQNAFFESLKTITNILAFSDIYVNLHIYFIF